MHGSPLGHVGAVRAEAQVAVVVGFGGGHARGVIYFNCFGALIVAVLAVAGNGCFHGGIDPRIGIVLVGRGIGSLLNGPVEGGAGDC